MNIKLISENTWAIAGIFTGIAVALTCVYLEAWLATTLSIIFTIQFSFFLAFLERFYRMMNSLKTTVNSSPEELRKALSQRPHEVLGALNRHFDRITQDLIQGHDTLHKNVVDFVERSIKRIVEQGFLTARVEFPTYQKEAISFVTDLYQANCRNDIWTVCLYCPLEYLLMRIHQTQRGQSWSQHLPVFDGVLPDGRDLKILTKRDTQTHFVRIVYMEEERLQNYLDPEKTAPDVKTDHNARDLSHAVCFAFIWFLFYNRLIKLYWAWKGGPGSLTGNGDLSEDFMIFNGEQFLRYDKKYKSLMLCWSPENAGVFSRAFEIFRDATGIFCAIHSDHAFVSDIRVNNAIEHLNEGHELPQVRAAHQEKLFSLFRNNGTRFSSDPNLRTVVAQLFKEVLEMAGSATGWPHTTHRDEIEGRDAFFAAIQVLTAVFAEDDNRPERMEEVLSGHLNALTEEQLGRLYTFLDSGYFVEGVKALFPITSIKELAEELVPGIHEWPIENNH